jgi:predicted TPR repeat methyltransferase
VRLAARRSKLVKEPQQIYRERQLRAIAERWDARACGWERSLGEPACHLNEDDAYPRFLRQALKEINRRRAFCRTHGVIDLACGTGLVLASVIPAFAWGMGVDISPKMIQIARRKGLTSAQFVVGDGFNLARICKPAGAIFSRGVLLSHYGSEHGAALLAATRAVLMPGGFLMCDFLNRMAEDKYEHRPHGKTHFSGPEAGQLAHEAGYSNVRVLGKSCQRVLILLIER